MAQLYKLKCIKDTELLKEGQEFQASKKNAESYVSNGYAEYIEETQVLAKEGMKKLTEQKKKTPKEIEVEEVKKILKQKKADQELEDFKEGEINWLDDEFYDSWDKVKSRAKKLWKHKKEYSGETPKWFFLAHHKDTIIGRPQMIESVKIRMPLVRIAVKKMKPKKNDPDFPSVDENGEVKAQSFYFFDERFDKRHDGFQKDAFAMDFYKYLVETPDDKKFYIITQEKLPNETCTFKGMSIELDDWNELSRTMKLPSLSRIFFVKEFEPAVKIMKKEELVKLVKDKKMNEQKWLDYLAIHKLGTLNNFPEEVELLRSAFILSGKVDGWPLHLGIIGPAGTRKTMGHGESLAYKFTENEEEMIADSGNSRLRGMIPSFKGTITKPGFLSTSERLGVVDEIGKMVEDELDRHDQAGTNVLGKFNPILEHKHRKIVSGNTDDCNMVATAKFLFLTNPIKNKSTIYEHLDVLDATTMSRIFWWVQDSEEVKLVLGENGILRNPPKTSTSPPKKSNPPDTFTSLYIENRKKDIFLKKSWGRYILEYIDRDSFLCIFDTCYSFLCEIDDEKIQELCDEITDLALEPMKTSVWKPRSYHHVKLLVDGLCKHRCLFNDYDSSFVAKQEDYDLAKKILTRMVKGWSTNLSPKGSFR